MVIGQLGGEVRANISQLDSNFRSGMSRDHLKTSAEPLAHRSETEVSESANAFDAVLPSVRLRVRPTARARARELGRGRLA